MANAKLTGSLLVYKDLPSAVLTRLKLPVETTAGALLHADQEQAAKAAPRRDHGRIIRFAPAGFGIAVAATAALFFVLQTGAQPGTTATTHSMPATTSASAAEEVARDRIAGSPSALPTVAVVESAAMPQPAPETPTAAAEDSKPSIPAAPAASVSDGALVEGAAPPPQPDAEAPVPPVEAKLSAEQLAALVMKGNQLFGAGDIASARLFYERAAEAGDARAALQLAESYDATFLYRSGLTAVRGDPVAAVRWYERARRLGSVEADILLRRLVASGKQASAGQMTR